MDLPEFQAFWKAHILPWLWSEANRFDINTDDDEDGDDEAEAAAEAPGAAPAQAPATATKQQHGQASATATKPFASTPMKTTPAGIAAESVASPPSTALRRAEPDRFSALTLSVHHPSGGEATLEEEQPHAKHSEGTQARDQPQQTYQPQARRAVDAQELPKLLPTREDGMVAETPPDKSEAMRIGSAAGAAAAGLASALQGVVGAADTRAATIAAAVAAALAAVPVECATEEAAAAAATAALAAARWAPTSIGHQQTMGLETRPDLTARLEQVLLRLEAAECNAAVSFPAAMAPVHNAHSLDDLKDRAALFRARAQGMAMGRMAKGGHLPRVAPRAVPAGKGVTVLRGAQAPTSARPPWRSVSKTSNHLKL